MNNVSPFILRFKEERQGDLLTPGRYSDDHDLTVIELNGLTVPLISATKNILETKTVTKCVGERED